MSNLLLLPLCLVAGFFLRRQRVFPAGAPQTLNAFIIWISFPALVLVQIPVLMKSLHFSTAMLIPLLAVWIAFTLTAAVIVLLSRSLRLSRATTGALILTAGLGNTSFVGFPVIEALYGSAGMSYALILDQGGSFLVLSTLGILCASYYSGTNVKPLKVLKGIVSFPPFVAIVAGVLLNGTGWIAPALPTLERLSATLVPLALVSVGCQLHVDPRLLARRFPPLALGLALKLILIPLVFAAGFWLLSCHDLSCRVTLLEVAMGPMITGAIIASQFGLDEEIGNLMVGLGTPLSLLTVWLWYLIY